MAQQGCLVRPAQPADISTILELCAEMERVHQQAHPDLYSSTGVTFRDAALIERTLADPNVGLLVAELSQTESPAVFGMLRVVEVQTPQGRSLVSRRFALVDELVVGRGARRKGVATQLLLAAEAWSRARGLEAMEVTVWAFNLAAQELYRKHGFAALRHYSRKRLVP